MRPLSLQPFTQERYAPYGDVLEAAPQGAPGRLVNQGFVRRFDHVAPVANLRSHATLNLAFFRCQPRSLDNFVVTQLERHIASTQAFVPAGDARYLVVTALGGDRPDLSTLAAFLVEGARGVSYHPGVWHLPLVALDHVTDFACVVYEDGTADDCGVAMLSEDEQVVLVM